MTFQRSLVGGVAIALIAAGVTWLMDGSWLGFILKYVSYLLPDCWLHGNCGTSTAKHAKMLPIITGVIVVVLYVFMPLTLKLIPIPSLVSSLLFSNLVWWFMQPHEDADGVKTPSALTNLVGYENLMWAMSVAMGVGAVSGYILLFAFNKLAGRETRSPMDMYRGNYQLMAQQQAMRQMALRQQQMQRFAQMRAQTHPQVPQAGPTHNQAVQGHYQAIDTRFQQQQQQVVP